MSMSIKNIAKVAAIALAALVIGKKTPVIKDYL